MKLVNLLDFANVYTLIKDEKMPFTTAYKLMKLAARIEQETAFYRTELQKIIQTYAVKDEGGAPLMTNDGGIKLIEGKEEECGQRIVELQNLEVDIEPTLKLSEMEQFQLSPTEILGLMPFIIE